MSCARVNCAVAIFNLLKPQNRKKSSIFSSLIICYFPEQFAALGSADLILLISTIVLLWINNLIFITPEAVGFSEGINDSLSLVEKWENTKNWHHLCVFIFKLRFGIVIHWTYCTLLYSALFAKTQSHTVWSEESLKLKNCLYQAQYQSMLPFTVQFTRRFFVLWVFVCVVNANVFLEFSNLFAFHSVISSI